MATAKQWEKYLRECGYQSGSSMLYTADVIMARNASGAVEVNQLSGSSLECRAADLNGYIPLRIFTPDGKTQKGKDYVPEPSKRERIAEELRAAFEKGAKNSMEDKRWWYPVECPAVDRILKICEVEE